MSVEFEYLLQKSRCEMLISRDDISNDVITIPLALAFNVCIHLQLFPLCAVWRKSDSEFSCRRAIGELEVEFKFQRCSCKLSFLFRILFTVGNVDRDIGRYSGRHSGRYSGRQSVDSRSILGR